MTSNEERRKVAANLREVAYAHNHDVAIHSDEFHGFLGIGNNQHYVLRSAVLHLADLIDRPTCSMVDIGDYQPKHRFKRMACSECGAMHWEQPQKTLPRMRYCPWCGREVVE